MKTYKKGISLIVLVITIIVLAILSTTVIITLNNTNLIERTKDAADKNHDSNDKEQVLLAVQDYIVLNKEITGTLADALKQNDWCSNAIYDETTKTTTVTMKDCGHQYQILENGIIVKIVEDTRDTSITLSGDLPAGTYTLRYEDANGIMSDYAEICSLEITDSEDDVAYDGFIPQNYAPLGATAIGVYNSSNERVSELALGDLALTGLGEKQYSFAALSDTHVGAKTAEDDLKNALTFIEEEADIEFTAIDGDLTLSGTDTNLALYKSTVDNYTTKPVYAIAGNHEAGRGYLELDSLQAYTGQNLYYSFTHGEDVYIMLGMWDVHDGEWISDEQLIWLYETLEANRNKRCFLFMHLFPEDGSGDAVNMDVAGEVLKNRRGEIFYSLISHYTNVIWFHGHSHEAFEIQEVNKMNNYDNIFGIHSVHIPSLAYPKYISGNTLVANYDASEGYIVDVYENYIVLKGRDFVTGEFLPIASYCLNTTLKNVEANTYYDPTGTITNSNSNVFKSGSTWYEGAVNKNTITKITFADSYSGTNHDESWDASISGNNLIMVYRTGTELTIVGNEHGIVANANSNEMFSGFTSLTQINGLEKLNASKITSLEGMFKNCSSLTALDLSTFNGVKPATMVNVFNGCSKLTSIDISNFDLKNVNKYQNLFYNCSSLTEVKLPNKVSSDVQSAYGLYLNAMFRDCTSLTKVDMTMFAERQITLGSTFNGCTALVDVKFGENKIIGSGLNGTFKDCSNLGKIDISGFDVSGCDNMAQTFEGCQTLKTLVLPEVFDTSKVTTMLKMFADCPLLTLDCSGWSTTSLTNITEFNLNSPGVSVPVLE